MRDSLKAKEHPRRQHTHGQNLRNRRGIGLKKRRERSRAGLLKHGNKEHEHREQE